MADWHLAQVNIGRLRAPLDHPQIAEFIALLDPINALAESSPGFVWRLQSGNGNATDVVYNEDPLTIVNISVWESVEALRGYVYGGRHLSTFRQRYDWFEKAEQPTYCLWWVPAGHLGVVATSNRKPPLRMG
ncbi:MAG: DUF3291 domain-containing protein [Bryobacteraceae bacterium]